MPSKPRLKPKPKKPSARRKGPAPPWTQKRTDSSPSKNSSSSEPSAAKNPTASSSGSTTTHRLTPRQRVAARKADAKRYAKDKPKRIAAEKAYQKKEKAQHPEIFKARSKINNAKRDGKISGPGGADFHHTSYDTAKPKGKWMPAKKHARLPNPKVPRTK